MSRTADYHCGRGIVSELICQGSLALNYVNYFPDRTVSVGCRAEILVCFICFRQLIVIGVGEPIFLMDFESLFCFLNSPARRFRVGSMEPTASSSYSPKYVLLKSSSYCCQCHSGFCNLKAGFEPFVVARVVFGVIVAKMGPLNDQRTRISVNKSWVY